MKIFPLPFIAVFACLLPLTNGLAEESFRVTIDYTRAPECEAFAQRSEATVTKWYPRINEILFSKTHPLPFPEVRLIFEPMKGVAHTEKNVIHVSAEWVTKKRPDDDGMIAHELTHVVQDYPGKPETWLTEGIADYIRDRYYEPGKRAVRINPDTSSYRDSYGVAAAFLIWLEANKDPGIVRRLNIALHEGKYTPAIFREYCAADLDVLWWQFAESHRQP